MSKKNKEIYVPRKLEETIRKYLKSKEIIAIVGPRQCGKTTLLKNVFSNLKNASFISFDDREILNLFDNDIKSFAEIYIINKDFLCIDEFQYSKEGGKNLKYLFDNYKTKIFISGSSVSELSLHSIRYLVGRVFVFTLYPFSFEEFLSYKDNKLRAFYSHNKTFSNEVIEMINKYYSEFLVYGGYPRVVLSKTDEEKQIVLKNIINTYILKEIKEILGYKEEYKLEKLLKALSLQIGSLVSYNELCALTAYSYKELIDALSILEKTFALVRSTPFYNNKRTELTKTPKFYFLD